MSNRRLETQHDEVIDIFRHHKHVKRSRIFDVYGLGMLDNTGFQYRIKLAAIKAVQQNEPLRITPVLWKPDGQYTAWWTGFPTDITMLMNLTRHERNEISLWDYKAMIAAGMALAGPYSQQALAARRAGGGLLLQAIIEREYPKDEVVLRTRELEEAGKTWGP